MSFEEFLAVWVPNHPDQMKPQISRFMSADGKMVANFLISYDRLQEGLEVVAERIKVPALARLPRENESPRAVSRADLAPGQIAWIEEHLRRDVEAMGRYCNRLRLPEAAEG